MRPRPYGGAHDKCVRIGSPYILRRQRHANKRTLAVLFAVSTNRAWCGTLRTTENTLNRGRGSLGANLAGGDANDVRIRGLTPSCAIE